MLIMQFLAKYRLRVMSFQYYTIINTIFCIENVWTTRIFFGKPQSNFVGRYSWKQVCHELNVKAIRKFACIYLNKEKIYYFITMTYFVSFTKFKNNKYSKTLNTNNLILTNNPIPVPTASSVPFSLTSTRALCTILLTNKCPCSTMLEKFAFSVNIVGHPSYNLYNKFQYVHSIGKS